MDCTTARERSVELLYGEADAETRGLLEEHHAACEACRADIEALRGVRRTLGQWKLPFSVERPVRLELPRRASRWPLVAAAAGLILATGLSLRLANARVELRGGPLQFSLGGPSASQIEARLAAQEKRHNDELWALAARVEQVAAVPAAGEGAPAGDETLAELRRLVSLESRRQQQELRASLARYEERAEARRRYDLARVSAGLSYLEGRTGQQVARTTELMNYVLKASQEK
ncbi:MAG: anti-sigma factor [Vicinamibacteria bacterium]